MANLDDVHLMVSLLRRLTVVSDATLGVIRDVLAEFDLSMSTASLLWALDPDTEPPTMRALSQHLHCDPSTISLMADKLDTSGLVERRPHPTDGRKRVLALTDKGLAAWAALSHRLAETSPLAVLSRADRERLDDLLAKAEEG